VDTPEIAIIGGGNMGRALIGGLVARGAAPGSIRVGEAIASCREGLERDFGVVTTAENAQAASGAGVIVVCVKPQDAGAALRSLRPQLAASRALVISVAAGIQVSSLQAWCGPEVPVVRAMPNRPALVGAGASGLYAPAGVDQRCRDRAEAIMSAVGAIVWLRAEEELDTVTALSGSGPAYFFYLAELMMQAAVELGLEESTARTLAVQTLYGAGRLAHESDGDLARLRAEVTSKGGTTEAALKVFGAGEALPALVTRALTAAADRGRELACQFGAEARR